jgi:hypothetical protein
MPETTQHDVSAHIKVVDQVSGPMARISGAVSKVSQGFNRLSAGFLSLTGIGAAAVGALSLKGIIESTNEHMRSVKRISTITGETAGHADGLVEAFAKVGIEGNEAERILLMMSRTGAKMEDTVMSTAMGVQNTSSRMRALGIDITHGPYKAMVGLAGAVQRGKLDVGHLTRMMGIRPQLALDFMKILQRGPQYLKATIDEMEKSGTAVTAENLASFQKFQDVKNEVLAGWKRIQIVVGKELYPVITQLLQNVKDKIPGWIEGAKAFGGFLRDNLQTAIGLAKTLGKVMMANAMIMRVSAMGGAGGGQGVGIGGAAKGIGSFIFGQGFGGSGVGSRSHALGSRMAGGLYSAGIGSPAMLGRLIPALGILGNIVPMLLRLTGVGVVILAVVGAFKAISENFMGIRGFLGEIWERLRATFAVFGRLFSDASPITKFFKLALPLAIGGLLMVVENIVSFVTKLARFIAEIIDKPTALLSPIETWKRVSAGVERETQAEIARARKQSAADALAETKAQSQRPGAPNFDFRGSRFSITQSFAEGFDPDRIAVAFANDLATLGERKLQSGFSPMFAVR